MSNGLTSEILIKSLGIFQGMETDEWKIVCVKFKENWLRIDCVILEIRSPWLMNLQYPYSAGIDFSRQNLTSV